MSRNTIPVNIFLSPGGTLQTAGGDGDRIKNMPGITDSLSFFHPLIQEWFVQQVGTPTEIQTKTWPLISRKDHVLITAPTGSGKTLTAFLWAINQLVTGEWPAGQVRVLYISPLKALNNDVQKNLIKPLEQLKLYFHDHNEPFPNISVMTRSGDTPHDQRQKMLRRPPEILITTPETLNILLSSKNNRNLLSVLTTVILDEIHAVLDSKRGTHLITAVERLVPLCGEFQRIALSATVNPLDKVARFVGGYQQLGRGEDTVYRERPVTTVHSSMSKDYHVQVCFPGTGTLTDDEDAWWKMLTDSFKEIINKNKSTLLFTNSRRMTEKVTRLVNVKEVEELVYSHHGSLSKEVRLAVEQKLKQGELRGIVATNSLELGIDIGALDEVVLVQSPFSISSAIQRVGRSGHGVGQTSYGKIYPIHGRDFVDAAVLAKGIIEGDLEEIHPIEGPLDILAQVILSMTGVEKWDIDELYSFLKTAYPYRSLSRKHYDLVLQMLSGRYTDSRVRELRARLTLDKIDNTVQAKDGVLFLVYMAGGTIPDRGYYDLRLADSRAKIGELDEEFVWERNTGESFTLGTQIWKIQQITHNDVLVTPEYDLLNIIPFWKAEERNRDYHFSQRIAAFLEEVNQRLNDEDYRDILIKEYHMTPEAADCMLNFVKLQKEITGTDLPHRHHVLVEHFDDPFNKGDHKQIIMHTFWGGKINHPFSLALAAAWEKEHNYPLQIFANNDAILFMLPHKFPVEDIFRLVTPENLEDLIRLKLEQTGFFGAHFRENAGRALLLPRANFKKRMPLWLNRLRSKKLLSAVQQFDDFPIVLETWRGCLQDEFDLAHLKELLDEIHCGKITFSNTITTSASPFSGNIIWKQTNKYMYEDDTPLAENKTSLSDSLIKELVFTSHLRPKIPAAVMEALDKKLKRTAPGYAPANYTDLLDWLKERLLIPLTEWEALLDAVETEIEAPVHPLIEKISDKAFVIEFRQLKFACAVESMPLVGDAFDLQEDYHVHSLISGEEKSLQRLKNNIRKILGQIPAEEADGEISPPAPGNPCYSFFSQWLAYYVPIELSRLKSIFGFDSYPEKVSILNQTLTELAEEQQIVLDTFGEQSLQPEVCDSKNLEILLRMTRKARRPAFKALEIEHLAPFLAAYQGILSHTEKLSGSSSIQEMQYNLEQLFGLPLPAHAWEEYVFPARLTPYYTSWLDSLMQSSDLIWYGADTKKLTFAFEQDRQLYQDRHTKNDGYERALSLFPGEQGRFSLFDLVHYSGQNTADMTGQLWQLTWQGLIANDSFAAIRSGLDTDFKAEKAGDVSSTRHRGRHSLHLKPALSHNRWQSTRPVAGNWYVLPPVEESNDSLEQNEIIKDRIRQLFKRYGILFKQLVKNEAKLFHWKNIFRQLRLMELSGEILSGFFFNGIPGVQFISHEAFRFLQNESFEDQIYWLNACDPASLCGLGLESLKGRLPTRIASNYLVYHGTELVMIIRKNGKELDIKVDPEHNALSDYLAVLKILITRDYHPLKKISIEKINGVEFGQSPYLESLKELGFARSYKSLDLWKKV